MTDEREIRRAIVAVLTDGLDAVSAKSRTALVDAIENGDIEITIRRDRE